MLVAGLRRQLVTTHWGAELSSKYTYVSFLCAAGCARTKAEVLWEWKPWTGRWVILHCVLNQRLTSRVSHMKRNEFARMLFPQWRLVSELLWPAGPGMVYHSVVSRQVTAFRGITFLLLSFLRWLKHRWHISELLRRIETLRITLTAIITILSHAERYPSSTNNIYDHLSNLNGGTDFFSLFQNPKAQCSSSGGLWWPNALLRHLLVCGLNFSSPQPITVPWNNQRPQLYVMPTRNITVNL